MGAAKLHATAAPSASRRTGPPTRGTVGRRGAPASTSWSPSDDGPSGPVDRWEGGAGGAVATSHGPKTGTTCTLRSLGAETAGEATRMLPVIYMLICL